MFQKRVWLAAPTVMALVMAVGGLAQRGPGPRTPVTGTASAEETKWLVFMREEEKLSRDVYRFLYDHWGLTVFDRIADAEAVHFASIGTLLTRYGIADPVVSDTPGVFADARLAAMYAELTAKSAVSIKDALEAGLAIETQDLDDLEAALKVAVRPDIKRVWVNLMDASFNHKEAFEFHLELLAAMQ